MRFVLLPLAAALAAASAGCATVVRGTTEQVQFDSEPSGAEVRTVVENACTPPNCGEQQGARDTAASYGPVAPTPPPAPVLGPACITPCTAQVGRRDVLIATFSKAGYKPQTVKVDTRVATGGAVAMAGNVIIGGVVGGVIDAGTGAALEHYPNPVKVILEPLPTAKPQPPRRRGTPTS
jgi:hypothetical protein